jgi:hypothetical protein
MFEDKAGTSSCGALQILNEGKSAAIFCHLVAAWFPDMFYNFSFTEKSKNS